MSELSEIQRSIQKEELVDRIVVHQGNAKVNGVLYGFTGVDRRLNAIKVYTGRDLRSFGLKASPLGNNEYRVKSHTLAEHQKAVDAYKPWLKEQMQNPQSAAFREIDRLADLVLSRNRIVLTCFCPEHLPCHARDVVKPAIVDFALQKQHQHQQKELMGIPSRRDNPSIRDREDYSSKLRADHILGQITNDVKTVVHIVGEQSYVKQRTDLIAISGGQDGSDKGGLQGAAAVGIPTGGYAPHGWLTESGPDPSLAEYGLIEGPQGKSTGHTYILRTHLNIDRSDATVVFGRAYPKLDAKREPELAAHYAQLRRQAITGGKNPNFDAGSRRTIEYASQQGKPWIHFDLNDLKQPGECAKLLREWAIENDVEILNIAGNRGSKVKGLQAAVAKVVSAAFREPVRDRLVNRDWQSGKQSSHSQAKLQAKAIASTQAELAADATARTQSKRRSKSKATVQDDEGR